MAKLIIPKTYVEVSEPLIFLAGPIRGAPNWQDAAIKYLFSKREDIAIASPRRGARDDIVNWMVRGNEGYFSRQRLWERHYMDLASKTGAIMFWLPGEADHRCEKAYGAMTRVELGEWGTRLSYDPSLRVCFGSDGKFSEIDTIKVDLIANAPDKKIFDTLEATCDEALRLARRK